MPHKLNPILKLLHELAPDRDGMRLVPKVIERYLGPWIGMTLSQRIRELSKVELAIVEEALEERLAIIQADTPPLSSTTSGGGATEQRGTTPRTSSASTSAATQMDLDRGSKLWPRPTGD